MNKVLIAGLATAAVAMFAADANATLQLATGIQNGNQGTENVLFNVGGLSNDALTVQGITNQSSQLVDFTSTTALHTNGGQSRIEALGGGTFTNIKINFDSATIGFGKLIFNIDSNVDGFAHIAALDQFGTTFDFGNQAISGSGQNFFTIFSNDNQVAISAKIDTSVGVAAISDLQQVRIGSADPTNVPEPATLAILGAGLVGLGWMRRKAS